jgi:hypothetical protein
MLVPIPQELSILEQCGGLVFPLELSQHTEITCTRNLFPWNKQMPIRAQVSFYEHNLPPELDQTQMVCSQRVTHLQPQSQPLRANCKPETQCHSHNQGA